MDILLIAGLWFDSSVWRDVAADLDGRGHRAVPVLLPGQGDGFAVATLDDQVAAVIAATDATAGPTLVVGHSAACTLAWIAADARPDKVVTTVLIGGFPQGNGDMYADYFEVRDGAMPFPGWEPFDGPDAADLDADTRSRLAAAAIGVPEGVSRGIVRLRDERRFAIPTVIVCPEFTPDDAREWVDSGDVPELARATTVDYIDLDSGHWPMVTKPAELADILAAAAQG